MGNGSTLIQNIYNNRRSNLWKKRKNKIRFNLIDT